MKIITRLQDGVQFPYSAMLATMPGFQVTEQADPVPVAAAIDQAGAVENDEADFQVSVVPDDQVPPLKRGPGRPRRTALAE